MAKLTQEQKEQFNDAKEWFTELEMRVFFSRDLRMMVGIMPDGGDSKNPLIYRMYVALCHPNDEFKKKLGLIQVCQAYDNNNFNLFRIPNMLDIDSFVVQYVQMFSNYEEFDFQEMELN